MRSATTDTNCSQSYRHSGESARTTDKDGYNLA